MKDEAVRGGHFGWRGWLGVLAGLATVGAFLAILAGIGWLVRPSSPAHPAPSPSHLSNDDYGYWYCWDAGDPRPHHLGARVSGDHLCTDVELHQATQTP
jgi:hypothetical protein